MARSRDAAASVGAQRHQGMGGHQLQEHGDTWGWTSPRFAHQLTDRSGHHQLSTEKPNLFEPWRGSACLEQGELCPWSWSAGMPFWGLYLTVMGQKSEEKEVRPKNIRRHLRDAPVHIRPYICSPQLLQMMAVNAFLPRDKGKSHPPGIHVCTSVCTHMQGSQKGQQRNWGIRQMGLFCHEEGQRRVSTSTLQEMSCTVCDFLEEAELYF